MKVTTAFSQKKYDLWCILKEIHGNGTPGCCNYIEAFLVLLLMSDHCTYWKTCFLKYVRTLPRIYLHFLSIICNYWFSAFLTLLVLSFNSWKKDQTCCFFFFDLSKIICWGMFRKSQGQTLLRKGPTVEEWKNRGSLFLLKFESISRIHPECQSLRFLSFIITFPWASFFLHIYVSKVM